MLICHRMIKACPIKHGMMDHPSSDGHTAIRRTLATMIGAIALSATAQAVPLSASNLFSGKTVAVSSTFGSSAFAASNLVDGTNLAHVFADGQSTARVSISGFDSSITTLRFFDTPSYDARVSDTVAIYRSSSVTNSLNTASYTLVGTYNLPTRNFDNASSLHDGYTIATSPAEHPRAGDPNVNTSMVISFGELTGLTIPTGTRSILFDFTEVHPSWGAGLSEIQAFGVIPTNPVPEGGGTLLTLSFGLLSLVFLRPRAPRCCVARP